jgi:hypothetical protein
MDGPRRQQPERQPAGVGAGADGVVDVHVCPDCASGLVHPTDWMPLDDVHWHVSLRCPECEWRSAGIFEQGVLDRYEKILNAGIDTLFADLRRLERTNMEAELRRFNAALGEDLILPEDF